MDAPRLEPAPFFASVADAPAGGQTHWVTTSDGLRIRLGHWGAGTKGTVLLFPGRTEYVEKYGMAAGEFATRGYAMMTVDWRGQGLADRMIDDPNHGHVTHFNDYQKDVSAMMSYAKWFNLPEPYYLVAHSMGGAIGLRALYNGLPVKAVAFSAPMWGIVMALALRPLAWSLSWASRTVGLDHTIAPGTQRESYFIKTDFRDNMLTSDPEMWKWMHNQITSHPELVLGGPSLRWLYEALNDTRSLSRRPAPEIPAVATLGSEEKIVDPERVRSRMAGWKNGSLLRIEGARHEVMMETPPLRAKFFDTACALFDANP